jgi:hypothetical protein
MNFSTRCFDVAINTRKCVLIELPQMGNLLLLFLPITVNRSVESWTRLVFCLLLWGSAMAEGEASDLQLRADEQTPHKPTSEGLDSELRDSASSNGREMSREEFIRSMGLAPDDLQEPGPQDTPPRLIDAELSRPPGDLPYVIEDDDWVRSTQFADKTLLQDESQEATNEAKRIIMASYRSTKSCYEENDSPSAQRRAADLCTKADHEAAQDYKAHLMEQFRKRKARGEALHAQLVSPARVHAAAK